MEENDRLKALLEIVNRAKLKKEQKEQAKKQKITDVEKFIKEYGVESGSTPVPNYFIYFLYKTAWNTNANKKNRILFFQIFSKYFHSQRSGRKRSYYLNKDSLNMTRDMLRRALDYDQRILEKERKERSKKRQQKIPLPTEGQEPEV